MNNDPHEIADFATTLQLRDVQAVGRPYRYLEGRAVPYDTWADVGPVWEQHRAGACKRSTNGRSGKGLPLLLSRRPAGKPAGFRWGCSAPRCPRR